MANLILSWIVVALVLNLDVDGATIAAQTTSQPTEWESNYNVTAKPPTLIVYDDGPCEDVTGVEITPENLAGTWFGGYSSNYDHHNKKQCLNVEHTAIDNTTVVFQKTFYITENDTGNLQLETINGTLTRIENATGKYALQIDQSSNKKRDIKNANVSKIITYVLFEKDNYIVNYKCREFNDTHQDIFFIFTRNQTLDNSTLSGIKEKLNSLNITETEPVFLPINHDNCAAEETEAPPTATELSWNSTTREETINDKNNTIASAVTSPVTSFAVTTSKPKLIKN